MKFLLVLLGAVTVLDGAFAADGPEPLKVLLVSGGGYHDYAKQKEVLKQGLEKRANVKVDHMYSDDGSTKPPLPLYGNPDYAKGYDVVIHDECAAGVADVAVVNGVIKPHRDGIPAVILHCAVHSYRADDFRKDPAPDSPGAIWAEFVGIYSSGHGPQFPIAITYADSSSPIAKGLKDWTTGKEELYDNVKVQPTTQMVARGTQAVPQKDGSTKDLTSVVAWTNMYGKTRVFTTTLAHNDPTVSDERYLDLVARGLLWACDKLNDDGTPKEGYGAPAP